MTGDGSHVPDQHTLDAGTAPQTFTLPYSGLTRSDGGDSYVRASLWANGTDVVVDSATLTWATDNALHSGSATSTDGGTMASADPTLFVSQLSGRLHWTLDAGSIGSTLDVDGGVFIRWDHDYSPLSGALTVTVHRAV